MLHHLIYLLSLRLLQNLRFVHHTVVVFKHKCQRDHDFVDALCILMKSVLKLLKPL